MRLDHFITKRTNLSEAAAKLAIAKGDVRVNGKQNTELQFEVDRFCAVQWQDNLLQPALEKVYLMLHKPQGYLSACQDAVGPVVLDLIDHPEKNTLHIAGRLDKSSTGLLLLTNDSKWSNALTEPKSKVDKSYLVETIDPIPESAVATFQRGFYFEYEKCWTQPAKLQILSPTSARVTLSEGKYHQVKRMFHRINGNRLKSLHRDRIGDYHLPEDLSPGEWLEL